MVGHVDAVAVDVVVPMHPPEVLRVGVVLVDGRRGRGDARVDRARVGQLAERGQHDALLAEPLDAVGQRRLVDDDVGEPELVDEGIVKGVSGERHG